MYSFILYEGLLFIFIGLIFGSFATALIHRVPLNLPITFQRSQCPKCGHNLSFLDLVPLFSWISNLGQCRYCGQPISSRYPILETLSAFMALAIYVRFGFSLESVILLIVIPIIVSLAFIDLDHFILPNSLVMCLSVIGLAFMLYQEYQSQWALDIAQDKLLAGIIYPAILLSLSITVKYFLNKDALGLGDVKLFAACGLFLGISPLPLFFCLSGILGVILGLGWRVWKKERVFPFGPAILVSFFIILLIQNTEMEKVFGF